MRHQTQKLMKSADEAMRAQNYVKAKQLLGKAMAGEPNDVDVRFKYASNLFELSDFAASAEVFHRLHVDAPDSRKVWNGCALAYIKLGNFDLATRFLKKLVGKEPENYDAWINLCFTAGSAGQHADTLFYAMRALELKPLDPRSHNNLGCSLLAVQRYKDALISYETAIKLQPDNLDALSNIATIGSLTGNSAEALEVYERCLQLAGPNIEFAETIKYRMSFDLLRSGRLKEGWAMYDHGFKPVDSRSRSPKRSFPVPQWDGQPLQHERLLVWREQGLGDELMFFAALRDVEQRVEHLTIECDPRLITTLQRSFPQATVRQTMVSNTPGLPPAEADMDFHIPAGSLMGIFRNTIDDFRRSEAYIKPDPALQAKFRERLAALPGRHKVGICWRSGMLNAERNSAYTSISDWEPLLCAPDIDIINLQYGDCAAELQNAADHFGVTIHQWDDLDLKNDLDGVFALASCLDHVVSVTAAPSVMAAAVGTPTSVLMPRSAWTLFGGDEYLIFPKMKPYISESGQALKELLPVLAKGVLESLENALP